MKNITSTSLVLVFAVISFMACNDLNTNNSLSCAESNMNEHQYQCGDVISSKSLVIGKTWESITNEHELSLVFDENDQFIYTSKKENIYNKSSYLLDSQNYKISISGLGCSQSGMYSYSIAYSEDHSQIMFKEEKDECADRKNILLSNDWKMFY